MEVLDEVDELEASEALDNDWDVVAAVLRTRNYSLLVFLFPKYSPGRAYSCGIRGARDRGRLG